MRNKYIYNWGIVLKPEDLHWQEWKNLLGQYFRLLVLHDYAENLVAFVKTKRWQELKDWLNGHKVDYEFAVHIASQLLPRKLFDKHPDLFRMDGKGNRNPDCNFCSSNKETFSMIEENFKIYALFKPTTGRYHFWPDDGALWCFCARCKKLSFSDQNLIFTNELANMLKKIDPQAKLSFLAYPPSLNCPRKIKPHRNVFLEFAPIDRCYRHSLKDKNCQKNSIRLRELKKLMRHFPSNDNQVLEYWLDVSKFSRWRKPFKKLPFFDKVLKDDLEIYTSFGFRWITTFGCWLNSDYVNKYGDFSLKGYLDRISIVEGERPKLV